MRRRSDSTLAPVTITAPCAAARRSKLVSSDSLAPTLQPVMQSPHSVQRFSFTPPLLGSWSMATVIGGRLKGRFGATDASATVLRSG
jgi:hypothetical protein